MVSDVLSRLAQRQGPAARPGSARDPDPSTETRRAQKTVRRGAAASARRSSSRAEQRPPHGRAGVEVDLDAGRHRPDLAARVEDPGVADAVGPGAVGLERRLVHVAGEHDVGPVLRRSSRRARRRRSRAGRSSRSASRAAASGTPRPSAPGAEPRRRRAALRPPRGPAGPSHHGQMVTSVSPIEQRVAVGRHAGGARLGQPQRRLLAVRVGAGEVVVARAHRDAAGRLQQRQVAQDHDGLRVERHRRADVEVVAGQHHEVEATARRARPSRAGAACSGGRRRGGCARFSRAPSARRELRVAPPVARSRSRSRSPSRRRAAPRCRRAGRASGSTQERMPQRRERARTRACGTGAEISGSVQRSTSTPAHTIANASSVPIETSSPSRPIGKQPRDHHRDDAGQQRREPRRAEARVHAPKTGGSRPSCAIV